MRCSGKDVIAVLLGPIVTVCDDSIVLCITLLSFPSQVFHPPHKHEAQIQSQEARLGGEFRVRWVWHSSVPRHTRIFASLWKTCCHKK